MKEINLNLQQIAALESGARVRSRMEQIVKRGIDTPFDSKFPHTYLFSLPGYGKTHTVESLLKQSKMEYLTVSGATSMFAFGVQLCVINHLVPKEEKIIIAVDDCDGILKNEENCNIMKNVLSGLRNFAYEKNLVSQIAQLSELQQEAISAHQDERSMGFKVPTDRFKFIFTSNFPLPTADEVKDLRDKGGAKNMLQVHRNAIRDRVKYADIHLSNDEQWGLVTDVLLNHINLPHATNEVKQDIIEFTWENWSKMTDRSIRVVEKMLDTVLESPFEYQDAWEIDYLR
jgi:hypothetical protein